MSCNAVVEDCRWCGSRAAAQPELGGGWRVACNRAHFGAATCRAVGPVRDNPLEAIRDWNAVMRQARRVAG